MTRDYVHYRRKRPQQGAKGPFLALLVLLLFLLAGSYVYYKPHYTWAELKENILLKLGTYFPHMLHKHKETVAPKKIAQREVETVKPIHFDFYDELPKSGFDLASSPPPAQETLADSEAVSTPPAKKIPAKDQEDLEDNIEQELASDLSTIQATQTAQATTPATAADYIIQVSIFPSLEAAKRYKAALAAAGLKVDLVRLKIGKSWVYSLQQGPYRDQEQLKSAKKRLNARGVACEIRKLPPYVS